MSRLAQFTALGFALAAALLASAPLMLLVDRALEAGATVVVVAGLFVGLAVPVLMAVLCRRLIRVWQPQAMWTVAIVSGLALAGLAALSL